MDRCLGICANATERQSNADYHARRVALAKQMEGGTLVLFAPTEAEGPNNLYGFRQDDNFFYSQAVRAGRGNPDQFQPLRRDSLSCRTQSDAGKMDWSQTGTGRRSGPSEDRL